MKNIDRTSTYEYFINILEKAPGHFYWKNKEGIYQGSNDAQAIFLGYKSARDLIGKTDFDLPWKEQASLLRKIDNQVMETREEYSVEETVFNSKGESFIFFSRKMPLYDPQTKKVIGVIGTSLDITKQKQAEQAKSAFVMNMAHDIRTPFSAIVGLAQCQAMYGLKTPEEVKDNGKMIYQSGNQLLEILDSVIIALEKNDINDIKRDKIDLYEFAQEMEELIKPSISINNLGFELNADKNIGKIVTDQIRLKQILANLLSNSVKFTPKGKIILSL
ncbi:PAS domain-containing sensor histidine kinase [Rickettsiella endosymbiont of Dermanyssus gallinae]|uniref:PAS domain-containing sensor histidine kinase n=1 Tax=Rickettsiella endosymbiont of Dermanyssus gallinae TaxID=2856608 RepID=UPI001C5293B1|nr:PAS domain-containing protein [Rickettsiella endosymbiont of Dermanyssus gallinae]